MLRLPGSVNKFVWIAICVAVVLTGKACTFSVVPVNCRWPAEAHSCQPRTQFGWYLGSVAPRLRPFQIGAGKAKGANEGNAAGDKDPLQDVLERIKKAEARRDKLEEKDPLDMQAFTAITMELVELFKEKNGLLDSAKPATASFATIEDLSNDMLGIMCKKGRDCTCVKAKTPKGFDLSLNALGASEGMGGMDLLKRTRTAELEKVQEFVRNQMSQRSNPSYRMSLIQVSQCSGIGKTTLLRLIASECPRILQQSGVEVPPAGIITSMITYNGEVMSMSMPNMAMESALSLRILYGALRMHSDVCGVACPNLIDFDLIAQNAMVAPGVLVVIALRILWLWFGPDRPILIAVDEVLKCRDGNEGQDEDKKVAMLATLMGQLLDRGKNSSYNVPPVLVIASALSPDRLLNAIMNSNRKLDNVVVYPLQQKDAVDVLRSQLFALNPGDRALGQFAALTGGHPRALQLTSEILKIYPDTTWLSQNEKGWIACRKAVLMAADNLTDGTEATLAREPDPALFEYLISHAPLSLSENRRITVDGIERRVDDLIYNGQVIVVSQNERLTVPSWWLLKYLRTSPENPSKYPFSTLLHKCYDALSPGVTDGGGLYETFGLFFIASAICRGGEALQAAAPWIQEVVPEDFTLPSPAAVRIERIPATDFPRHLSSIEKAKRLMAKVKYFCKDQVGMTILVMPPFFPALDAVIIINGQPVGVQFKSNLGDQTLTDKVTRVRKHLKEWEKEGHDVLGPSPRISYCIGVDKIPAGLTLGQGESFVTAAQLRDHFLDTFFRFGLTTNEDGLY